MNWVGWGVLGVGFCLSALPAAAEDYPTYQTLWDEASHGPGCSSSEYVDFVLVNCISRLTLWYFSKPNHPAHPGVIKRTIVQQADGAWAAQETGWSFATESAQPAFKAWLAQIQDLDRQMKEAIQKRHGTQAPASSN